MASGRFRTKLCRNYALGHCPQGDQCKYLHSHDIPSSVSYPMAQPMIQVTRGIPGFNPQFSYPVPTAPTTFAWPTLSPPMRGADMGGFNWVYTSTQPNVSFQAPAPQAPQFRPLSWRTTLCRHFVKNQGWCPLGDECGYIHDMALAAHAARDVRFPSDGYQGDSLGNNNNGRGKAGSKHSHCWAYVQGLCRVRDCPYLHPEAIHLFVPHTPCLAWPNCTRGPLCAYKHPEPLIPRVPELRPMVPPSMHIQPSSPVQHSPVRVIPSGTVQFHGTTYFPVAGNAPSRAPAPPAHQPHLPRAPPPIPMPMPPPPPSNMSSPHYTWNYANFSPVMNSGASGYSPYSPESIPIQSPHYETVSSLPAAAVPRAFTGPIYDDVHNVNGMPLSALPPIPGPVVEEHEAKESQKHDEPLEGDEFPYRPVPGQRAGHARRVSVTLKSKEDSDALGLPAVHKTRRESWMGHKQRDDPSHRSWPWAPDMTSGFAQSHSLQLML